MIIDLIILIFLIVMILVGWHRGLLLTLANLAATVFSLVLTWLLLDPVINLLESAPFMTPFADQITRRLVEPLQATSGSIRAAVGTLTLPPVLENLLLTKIPNPDSSVPQSWTDLSGQLFRFTLTAIVFILLFLAISFLIFWVSRALTKTMDKIPLIGFANHLGGLIGGLAFGLVIVHVLLLLCGLLAPWLTDLNKWLSGSILVNWFYEVNLLQRIMDTIY